MLLGRPQVGELLRDKGMITDEQLNAALKLARELRCRVGEALIRLGYCKEIEIARTLAEQMEVPLINLEETPPEPQCLALLPRRVARQFEVVPVRMEYGRLLVAARDPYDAAMEEALRRATRLPISPAIATGSDIMRFLHRHYPAEEWR